MDFIGFIICKINCEKEFQQKQIIIKIKKMSSNKKFIKTSSKEKKMPGKHFNKKKIIKFPLQ